MFRSRLCTLRWLYTDEGQFRMSLGMGTAHVTERTFKVSGRRAVTKEGQGRRELCSHDGRDPGCPRPRLLQGQWASRSWIWIQILKGKLCESQGCFRRWGHYVPYSGHSAGCTGVRALEGHPGLVTRAKLKGMCPENPGQWEPCRSLTTFRLLAPSSNGHTALASSYPGSGSELTIAWNEAVDPAVSFCGAGSGGSH